MSDPHVAWAEELAAIMDEVRSRPEMLQGFRLVGVLPAGTDRQGAAYFCKACKLPGAAVVLAGSRLLVMVLPELVRARRRRGGVAWGGPAVVD